VLSGGGALAWKIKPESIGAYLKLAVNARSARAHADAIFQQRGLQPNSYIHATALVNVTDPTTNEFLRERVGVARLNEILATQVPGAVAGPIFSRLATGGVCGSAETGWIATCDSAHLGG